jgi:uncharacterized RDD family membrane protein YckC
MAALSYELFFNARYAGTPGKWICRLEIVRARDRGPIAWAEAFKRVSVIAPLGFVYTYVSTVAALKVPEVLMRDIVDSIRNVDILQFLALSDRIPSAPVWPGCLIFLWYACDALSLVASPRKQSLHDRIAGTVVLERPQR